MYDELLQGTLVASPKPPQIFLGWPPKLYVKLQNNFMGYWVILSSCCFQTFELICWSHGMQDLENIFDNNP